MCTVVSIYTVVSEYWISKYRNIFCGIRTRIRRSRRRSKFLLWNLKYPSEDSAIIPSTRYIRTLARSSTRLLSRPAVWRTSHHCFRCPACDNRNIEVSTKCSEKNLGVIIERVGKKSWTSCIPNRNLRTDVRKTRIINSFDIPQWSHPFVQFFEQIIHRTFDIACHTRVPIGASVDEIIHQFID